MFSDNTTRSSKPLFLTVKSPSPIQISSELHHDALRQFALDGSIATMDHIDAVTVNTVDVGLDAIVIRRGLTKYIIEIDGDRPLRSIDDDGLYLLAAEQLGAKPSRLTAAFVQRCPALQNCRAVWNHRRRHVHRDSRIAIQDALRSGPATITDLQRRLGQEIAPDIFALACVTDVDIDIETDLDRSNVSLGRLAPRSAEVAEFGRGRRA